MLNNKTIKTLTIITALIAFGSGLGIYIAGQQQAQLPPQVQGMMWPNPKILGAFSTNDQDGEKFGLENLDGKWSFLFFGYTHCPDICPITLTILDQVYKKLRLADQHSDTQVIFVSVDPERDTNEQLNSYVSYFNEDFIGLGGSLEQVQSLTKQLGIAFFLHEASDSGEYLVDHSASVILIDPEGRMVAIFSAPHQVDSILSRFRQIRSFFEKRA